MRAPGWLLSVLTLALAAPLPAELPRILGVQGRLEDPVGVPASGIASLTVRLHDAPAAGSTDFTETDVVGFASGGVFSTVIGDGTTLPVEVFAQPRWVSFEVDGVPLGPRQPLTAAPYALRAAPASRFTRVVSPVLSGAVVDAVASGVALEAALDELATAAGSQPGRVLLEPGVYQLSAARTLPTSVRVIGAGREATVVRAGGTVTVEGASALEELRLELDPGSATGVLVGAGSTLELRRVALVGETDTGGPYRGLDVAGTARLRDCSLHLTGTGVGALQGIYGQGAEAVLDLADLELEATGNGAVTGLDSAGGELRVRGGRVVVDANQTGLGIFQSAPATVLDVQGTHLEARSAIGSAYGIDASGGRGRVHGVYVTVTSTKENLGMRLDTTSPGVVSGSTVEIALTAGTDSSLRGIELTGGNGDAVVTDSVIRISQTAATPQVQGLSFRAGKGAVSGVRVEIDVANLLGGKATGIYFLDEGVLSSAHVTLAVAGGEAEGVYLSDSTGHTLAGLVLDISTSGGDATGIRADNGDLHLSSSVLQVLTDQTAVGIWADDDAMVTTTRFLVQTTGGDEAFGVVADTGTGERVVVSASQLEVSAPSGAAYTSDNSGGIASPHVVFLGCLRKQGSPGVDEVSINCY